MYDHRKMIEDRVERLAEYVVANKATVRQTAEKFGYSKSTVHKDLTERLPQHSIMLYQEVRKVAQQNKAERHLRGGIATRKKFKEMKEMSL